MSGTGTKGNFFNTFLDTINDRSTAAPVYSPDAAKSAPPASAPVPVPAAPIFSGSPVPGDGMNRVLDFLMQQPKGIAGFSALLPMTEFSVDGLLATLSQLQGVGFISRDGDNVILTPSGHSVAAARQQLKA